MLTAIGGRVARAFVGAIRGWACSTVSAESVRDHLLEIMDTTDFSMPRSAREDTTFTAMSMPFEAAGRVLRAEPVRCPA